MNNDKMTDLLLQEIRQNRAEINDLRKELADFKLRVIIIVVLIGSVSGKIAQLVPFLS